MELDVICVGSITIDTIAVVPQLPHSDGRAVASEFVVAGGGPAATAAVALARLGLSVGFCGVIGDDADGAFVRDDSWRTDVEAFPELAQSAGVSSFIEGIVRPAVGAAWHSPEDGHPAVVEATSELSLGASVYKAEVPGYRPGAVSDVQEQSCQLTEAIDCPWVVLSNGVQQEDFADAVTDSCAGGADGFLAGQAIWSDTVVEPDSVDATISRSVDRLTNLVSIVENSTRRGATTKENGL